jgi:hypothetical protein
MRDSACQSERLADPGKSSWRGVISRKWAHPLGRNRIARVIPSRFSSTQPDTRAGCEYGKSFCGGSHELHIQNRCTSGSPAT